MAKSKVYMEGSVWGNLYGPLEVLEYVDKNTIKIRFLDTGYERYARGTHIKNGKVKDPFFPNVLGVGCIGLTSTSEEGTVKDSYHTWRGMLRRCYDDRNKSYESYGGRGVTVCDEWKCYATFEEWYNNSNYQEGFELDKDFTIPGSKIYSPDTCCFVPARINAIVGEKRKRDHIKHKDLPIGVSFHKRDKVYTAQGYDGEKLTHLGYHQTPEEAFVEYKTFKERHIKMVAEEEYRLNNISEEVYNTLMSWEVMPYTKRET